VWLDPLRDSGATPNLVVTDVVAAVEAADGLLDLLTTSHTGRQPLADRLTEDQVREIISVCEAGTPRWQLAGRYNINVSSVGRLLRQHGRRRKDRRGNVA
jgi:hypothetical protein